MGSLDPYVAKLGNRQPWRWRGQVIESVGNTIESAGPLAFVGECCEIRDEGGTLHLAEVIGFRGSHLLSMPLNSPEGVRLGHLITATGLRAAVAVGPGLKGQIVDANGAPLNGALVPGKKKRLQLDGTVRSPLDREPIRAPLGTGVKTVDALLTVGRGQRVGIFGGSGVGKSTLIGIMTRNTSADITVVALVGERGREVREFVEDALGAEGLARSVVVVSTSDQSPLMRMRAALTATTIAEYFAAQGKDVLLVVDSLTRYAMAAREIGLAAGEPPTAKGYTPSVFTRLAKIVERAGNFTSGSITAFYTVLMEGDDEQDPLVDAVRSLLDGHIVLSRRLAMEGSYPPIDVLASISRLMPAITKREHRDDAGRLRQLMAAYTRSEDLVRIGAYKAGSDPELEAALRVRPAWRDFMMQTPDQHVSYHESISGLASIMRDA